MWDSDTHNFFFSQGECAQKGQGFLKLQLVFCDDGRKLHVSILSVNLKMCCSISWLQDGLILPPTDNVTSLSSVYMLMCEMKLLIIVSTFRRIGMWFIRNNHRKLAETKIMIQWKKTSSVLEKLQVCSPDYRHKKRTQPACLQDTQSQPPVSTAAQWPGVTVT